MVWVVKLGGFELGGGFVGAGNAVEDAVEDEDGFQRCLRTLYIHCSP